MMMNNKIYDDFIVDCAKMIAIDSVIAPAKPQQPFGAKIDLALKTILDISEKLGYQTFCDPEGYYGYAEIGDNQSELFGILCHVDVVPANDLGKWYTDPFELMIENNKLYGRGIQDDKGPTLLCLYAIKHLLEQGYQPKKRIRFIFGTDEENLWRCIKRYQMNEEIPQAGIAPDSIFPVTNAEKGLLQFDLIAEEKIKFTMQGGEAYNSVAAQVQTTYSDVLAKELKSNKIKYTDIDDRIEVFGTSAHVKDADKGDNAIVKLAQVFKKMDYQSRMLDFIVEKGSDPHGTLLFGEVCDEVSGQLMMNIGKASFAYEKQKISCDLRIPVTYDKKKIDSVINDICQEYQLTYQLVDYVEPLYVNEDTSLVQNLMKAYQEVIHDYETKPLASGGATYARAMANFVAFGADLPTSKTMAHQANECADIEDYKVAFKIYVEAFKLLLF